MNIYIDITGHVGKEEKKLTFTRKEMFIEVRIK